MTYPRGFRIIVLLVSILLGLSLTGCIIITNNTDTKNSGKAIPDDVFAQVQPGQTKDAVINLLGQPSQKVTENAGSEVWKWTYTETKTAERAFIVLFSGESKTTTTQTTVVEFDQDGKVTKVWRE
jgi:outer membrane protein assembly factor BamE (lipoprotein component of BamABCDE complex)